jgi:hypothetical protein
VNPAATTNVPEDGIKVDFAFGVGNYALNDTFHFNGLGPSLFEIDVRHTNTNENYSVRKSPRRHYQYWNWYGYARI